MTESSISAREFDQFRLLAHQKFGLDLPDGKQQLVASRLGKKMRELNLNSLNAYYNHVVEDRTGEALTAMIDALTTNHTSFFRESVHFDFLRRTVLPSLRSRGSLSFWSAACSSGEEPYSLAFSLFDELGPESLSKLRILATDISTRVLSLAQVAVYPADRFRGVSPDQLRRYVLKGEGKHKDNFMVKRQFRDTIEFRRLNLMEDLSQVGPFPVIFCRNVMIYFDGPTKAKLIERFVRLIRPGGWLYIGHSESLIGSHPGLQLMGRTIYRRDA
jgi:chemotaxis protein methyltransferase CheR